MLFRPLVSLMLRVMGLLMWRTCSWLWKTPMEPTCRENSVMWSGSFSMLFDTRWGSRCERSCLFECNRDTSSDIQSWPCQVTMQIILIVWPSCCPLLPFMLIQGLWISSPSPRTVSQLMLPKSWNSCTGIASPAALSHSLCWKATTASAPWGHL